MTQGSARVSHSLTVDSRGRSGGREITLSINARPGDALSEVVLNRVLARCGYRRLGNRDILRLKGAGIVDIAEGVHPAQVRKEPGVQIRVDGELVGTVRRRIEVPPTDLVKDLCDGFCRRSLRQMDLAR